MSDLGPAMFIYFAKNTGEAFVMRFRDDVTACVLLFTCPEAWLPANQTQFEAAAHYYGVKQPERMRYNPDEVPF